MRRRAALIALLSACSRSAEPPSDRAAPPPARVDARARAQGDSEADSLLPPLRAHGEDGGDVWFVPLAVPGFADAVVSIPWDARRPMPVVVVAHGYDDRPEGQCDVWRYIVGERAFVLCTRGVPVTGTPYKGFSYRGSDALAKETDAALSALRARFGEHVARGPMLYAGFSLGANLGVSVVTRDPARFPYVVLGEGGEGWSDPAIREFVRKGGKRVLFVCGLRSRVPAARSVAERMKRLGLDAEVALGKLGDAGEFMHWYNGPVADETKGKIDWLVAGDERWRLPVMAP